MYNRYTCEGNPYFDMFVCKQKIQCRDQVEILLEETYEGV